MARGAVDIGGALGLSLIPQAPRPPQGLEQEIHMELVPLVWLDTSSSKPGPFSRAGSQWIFKFLPSDVSLGFSRPWRMFPLDLGLEALLVSYRSTHYLDSLTGV